MTVHLSHLHFLSFPDRRLTLFQASEAEHGKVTDMWYREDLFKPATGMHVCSEGSQLDEISCSESNSCDQNGVLMCNDCKQFNVTVLKKTGEYNDDNHNQSQSVGDLLISLYTGAQADTK